MAYSGYKNSGYKSGGGGGYYKSAYGTEQSFAWQLGVLFGLVNSLAAELKSERAVYAKVSDKTFWAFVKHFIELYYNTCGYLRGDGRKVAGRAKVLFDSGRLCIRGKGFSLGVVDELIEVYEDYNRAIHASPLINLITETTTFVDSGR